MAAYTCIMCSLKFFRYASAIFGISLVRSRCTHENTLKCRAEKSIVLVVISYAIAVTLTVEIYRDFSTSYDRCTFWEVESMVTFGKLLIGLNSVSMVFCFTYHTEKVVMMMNNMAEIISALEFIDEARLKRSLSHFRLKSIICVFVSLILSFSTGIYEYVHGKLSASLFTIIKVYVISIYAIGVASILDVYTIALSIVYEAIEKSLGYIADVRGLRGMEKPRCLTYGFQNLLNFRISFRDSLNIINDYCNPGVIIYISLTIATTYVLIYVNLVNAVSFDLQEMTANFPKSSVFLACLLPPVYTCFVAQSMLTFNDKMINYIYRFSTTKLPVKYRYKTETLLVSLEMQYFEIKPSSMITISKTTLTTLVYIMMIYIAVGLQFYQQEKADGK